MNQPVSHPLPVAAQAASAEHAEVVRTMESGAFDDVKVELIDGRPERMNPPISGHGARQASVRFGQPLPLSTTGRTIVLG